MCKVKVKVCGSNQNIIEMLEQLYETILIKSE